MSGDDYSSPRFRGYIAEERTNLAYFPAARLDEAFLDSGAKHHFFWDRKLLLTYPLINATVATAVGNSQLIGKGKFMLPIDEATVVSAHHAPKYSSHVLFAGVRAHESGLDVYIRKRDGQTSATSTHQGSNEVILKAPLEYGLFPQSTDDRQATNDARR